MKPTTLADALSMLPTHWPLMPSDYIKPGDWVYNNHKKTWQEVTKTTYWFAEETKHQILCKETIARRPMPQDVIERIANIMLVMTKTDIPVEENYAFPLESWILAGKP